MSFTAASRSSRASKEACRVEGMASDGSGPRSTYRSPISLSSPLSSTVLVSSSTNKGTPSVCERRWFTTSFGISFPSATLRASASASRFPRRLSVTVETCVWLGQGGANSGRAVITSKMGRPVMRSTASEKSSSEVGSYQWASSKIMSTGCRVARTSS